MKKAIFLLILILFLSYANSLNGRFVWDDKWLVIENESIKKPDIFKIFTQELYPESGTNYYRPLQTLSYCLDYFLWKLNPFGYHLTSLIIHIINTILIYLLLQRIFSARLVSLLTAILFGIHPIHTEVVNYISSRADLLAGLFLLLCIYQYTKFKIRNKNSCLLASIFFFCLALFSKEMAFILPIFLLALETLYFKEEKSKIIKNTLWFWIIAVLYIFMRFTILNFSTQGLLQRGSFYLEINVFARILAFLKGIGLYITLYLLPTNLHMERYISPLKSLVDINLLEFLLGFSLLFLILRKATSKEKIKLYFGISWFVVFLLPQSNLIFPRLIAEHFLYLPSVGLSLILGYLLGLFWRWKKNLCLFTTFTLCLFFITLTASFNLNWKTPLTFYRWTLRYSPQSLRIRVNLADTYTSYGQIDLAIQEYERVLSMGKDLSFKEFKRRSFLPLEVILYNLGVLYRQKGEDEKAKQFFQSTLELDPYMVDAYNNLGNIYENRGKFDAALEQYKKAVEIAPSFAQGYYNIGVVLSNQGKLPEAIDYWQKVVQLDPTYEKAIMNIKKAEEMLKEENSANK